VTSLAVEYEKLVIATFFDSYGVVTLTKDAFFTRQVERKQIVSRRGALKL